MKTTFTALVCFGQRGIIEQENGGQPIAWANAYIVSSDLEDANEGDPDRRSFGFKPMKVKALPEVFDNLPGPLPGEYQVIADIKAGKDLAGSLVVHSIEALPDDDKTKSAPANRASKGTTSNTNAAA